MSFIFTNPRNTPDLDLDDEEQNDPPPRRGRGSTYIPPESAAAVAGAFANGENGNDSDESEERQPYEVANDALDEGIANNGGIDQEDIEEIEEVIQEETSGASVRRRNNQIVERYREIRTLSRTFGLVNNVSPVSRNNENISIIKRSPMISLLHLENSFVEYNKIFNEDNSLITRIEDIVINLNSHQNLRQLEGSAYPGFFDEIVFQLGVNLNNRISLLIPSNASESQLFQKIDLTPLQIKESSIISLNYTYNMNIHPERSFTKKIFIYEINDFNEVIGEAKYEFGNSSFNININALF
jgi:hypothetical protein